MIITDVINLIRPNIINLKPYSSARHEFSGNANVFLDANENPYGSPLTQSFNRYPDPLQLDIKKKLSEIKNVPIDRIFVGHGSDETIDIIIRMFCVPNQDEIIILPPTYGMYEVAANIHDIKVQKVVLTDDFQPDLSAIKKNISPHTKIIFFCSPNNPTGNLIEPFAIQDILENFHGIVVIDEAYIDYAPSSSSWLNNLSRYPNLIILQTLSKAWGLAGLRLGMAFAHPSIIEIMNKVKMPYNINSLTQQKVLEALNNIQFLNDSIEKNNQEKEKLYQALKKFSFISKIYPTDANFILVQFDNPNEIYLHLLNYKIVVRNRSQVEKCEGCLRITIGTSEENQLLLNALSSFKSSSL